MWLRRARKSRLAPVRSSGVAMELSTLPYGTASRQPRVRPPASSHPPEHRAAVVAAAAEAPFLSLDAVSQAAKAGDAPDGGFKMNGKASPEGIWREQLPARTQDLCSVQSERRVVQRCWDHCLRLGAWAFPVVSRDDTASVSGLHGCV